MCKKITLSVAKNCNFKHELPSVDDPSVLKVKNLNAEYIY